MRKAPAERMLAQKHLLELGWTEVTVDKFENKTMFDAMKWCEDHIGVGRPEPALWLDGNDVWYAFTWFGYWHFYFKHEKDAIAFSLRWV